MTLRWPDYVDTHRQRVRFGSSHLSRSLFVIALLGCTSFAQAQSRPSPPSATEPARTAPTQPIKADQALPPPIGTTQSPAVVRVLPAEQDPQEVAEERAQRQAQAAANRWIVRLTAAVALFTFGLIAVGVLQWRTYKATLAANKVVERAYVDISHQSRPGLRFLAVPDSQDRKPYLVAEIKNHGKTPADLVAILMRLVVAAVPPAKPVYGDDRKELRAVVMPGESLQTPWPFLQISDALYNSIQAGQMTVWVIGYIDYRDRFGTLHRGGYTRRYDPETDRTVPENNRNNLVFEVLPD